MTPAVLELLDALDHRRRGEADLLADLGQRPLAVLLQQREDAQVDVVEIHLFLIEFHKVCELQIVEVRTGFKGSTE